MANNNMDHLTWEPYLVMLIEPENKVRFRYKSEGASHGGLLGKKEGKGKKVYPTVKLEGYDGKNPVFIRVRLYTDDKQPHVLEFVLPGSSEESVPYIDEYIKEDNTAEFSNLKFLSKKKEEIFQQLLDAKMKLLGEKRKSLRKTYEQKYGKELKERAKNIMNSVRLRFEAFEKHRSGTLSLCEPLFSELICNQKAASKGELRIHRMSRVSGTWKGGDEVILLCDKVQKENIEIIFYEPDYTEYWEEKAIFQPVDVHYQVAITFKTPQYKFNSEKTVLVCLSRNGERSEPLEFTYIPDFEENPPKKRKMHPKELVTYCVSESPGTSNNEYSNDSSESPVQEQAVDNVNGHLPSDLLKEFTNDMANLGTDELEILNGIMNNDLLFQEVISTMHEDDCVMAEADGIINQPERVFNQSLTLPFTGATQIDGPYFAQMSGESSLESFGISCMKKSVSEVKSKQYHTKKQFQQKIYSLLMKKDDSGNTLLHVAVYKKKDVKFIITLCEFANIQLINMKNDYQETALHIATERNYKEVVKILLKCDGNPNLKNNKGNNCYHLASQGNYFDVMQYLLLLSPQKPELDAFNYEGLTPLHIAVANNSKDCFHLLKLNSADIKTLDQKSGRSLLHYAVEFQPSFVTEILKEEVIDVNVQDFGGNTPLHLACSNGNVDIIKQLLKAGADPLLKNFKCKILDKEISVDDDDDVFGETPGDCTSNPEIHEILRKASVSEDCMEELCSLLDKNLKWKEVALYVLDEEFINSLECSTSPSKTLLHHMKKIEKDGFLEKLQNIIHLTGPNEALQIIKGKHC